MSRSCLSGSGVQISELAGQQGPTNDRRRRPIVKFERPTPIRAGHEIAHNTFATFKRPVTSSTCLPSSNQRPQDGHSCPSHFTTDYASTAAPGKVRRQLWSAKLTLDGRGRPSYRRFGIFVPCHLRHLCHLRDLGLLRSLHRTHHYTTGRPMQVLN